MNKPATGMEKRNSFFGGNPFFEGHTGLIRIGRQKWHDLGRSPFRFEARSLALTRAACKKIRESAQPREYIRQALAWAERFSKERPEDKWLAEWVSILRGAMTSDDGITAMYDMMIAETEHGIDMRQSSPWAGVLTTHERTQVLSHFADEWKRIHGDD